MDPSVVQLIVGNTIIAEDGSVHAWGSVTLVKGSCNLLIDTGLPSQRDEILKAISEHYLDADNIDFVVLTHGHSDHIGNNNLFPKATFIMDSDICKGSLYTTHDFNTSPLELCPGIQVIATPGHTDHDLSVLVTSPFGIYAITGDLFEKEQDLLQPELWQPWSKNIEAQQKQSLMLWQRL